nr:MAG TPA: Lethal factor [Caudoviricetes sp.]
MGRNSGSVGSQGGLKPGDSSYKGKISKVEPLVNMKDKQVYKDTKGAISRYHAVMGVRQRNVKLADMAGGVLGVHVTKNGASDAVYLNKKYFNQKRKNILSQTKKGYSSGWHTTTNKPMAHTITHELAHATWNAHLGGANHKAAGKEINALYRSWMKDKKKKGYGKYATTNVSEFWAETVTKAVHGKPDKYTKKVKAIAKKYKL